jgi:chromosome segregation ATPase
MGKTGDEKTGHCAACGKKVPVTLAYGTVGTEWDVIEIVVKAHECGQKTQEPAQARENEARDALLHSAATEKIESLIKERDGLAKELQEAKAREQRLGDSYVSMVNRDGRNGDRELELVQQRDLARAEALKWRGQAEQENEAHSSCEWERRAESAEKERDHLTKQLEKSILAVGGYADRTTELINERDRLSKELDAVRRKLLSYSEQLEWYGSKGVEFDRLKAVTIPQLERECDQARAQAEGWKKRALNDETEFWKRRAEELRIALEQAGDLLGERSQQLTAAEQEKSNARKAAKELLQLWDVPGNAEQHRLAKENEDLRERLKDLEGTLRAAASNDQNELAKLKLESDRLKEKLEEANKRANVNAVGCFKAREENDSLRATLAEVSEACRDHVHEDHLLGLTEERDRLTRELEAERKLRATDNTTLNKMGMDVVGERDLAQAEVEKRKLWVSREDYQWLIDRSNEKLASLQHRAESAERDRDALRKGNLEKYGTTEANELLQLRAERDLLKKDLEEAEVHAKGLVEADVRNQWAAKKMLAEMEGERDLAQAEARSLQNSKGVCRCPADCYDTPGGHNDWCPASSRYIPLDQWKRRAEAAGKERDRLEAMGPSGSSSTLKSAHSKVALSEVEQSKVAQSKIEQTGLDQSVPGRVAGPPQIDPKVLMDFIIAVVRAGDPGVAFAIDAELRKAKRTKTGQKEE